MPLFRFRKTGTESLSMLKGENSWYLISDETGATVLHCHVMGNCLGGTTTFHASREEETVLFEMRPKRKMLNLTYFIFEGGSESSFATIRLYAGRGLKATDSEGQDLFEVIDPQGKLDKFMQDLLDGCCSSYAIVADDHVVGGFERRKRPQSETEAPKNPVRKVLKRVFSSLLTDYCVEIDNECLGRVDQRVLLASMILLMEQTIRMDQAS